MTFLSLRLTLGAIAAISVACVTAFTLGIALSTGLAALRSIGRDHAASIAGRATDRTETFFGTATTPLTSLQEYVGERRWSYPSEDAVTFERFAGVAETLFINTRSTANGFILFFKDNSIISVNKAYTGSSYYTFDRVYATPYNTTFPNSTLTQVREVRYVSNLTLLPPNLPGVEYTATSNRVSDGAWATSLMGATGGGVTPYNLGVFAFTLNGLDGSYILMAMPTYLKGDSHIGANVYMVATLQFDFRSISTFLKTLQATPHSVVVAYDSFGYLLGTSVDEPYASITLTPATGRPTGCVDVTESSPSRMLCRSHVSDYQTDSALHSVAKSHQDLLYSTTATTEQVAVSGDNYFVSVSPVKMAFPGMQMSIALVMPEADIIGDVVSGRNTAIGIAAAMVVVAATVNAVLVALLLSPLQRIATRMLDAANLEDDDVRDEPSAMSEVRALQDAYFEMNEELRRIRSFVPQSVLVARRCDRNLDPELAHSVCASELARESPRQDDNASGRAPSISSIVQSHSSAQQTSLALKTINVSIMYGNLRGTHALCLTAGVNLDEFAASFASTMEAVAGAVSSRQGVLSFHGDHFQATFNAARPCGSHARNAAEAALAILNASKGVEGTKQSVSIGVATGPCVVGSLGGASVKSFCTVGPAFTQAATLETIARGTAGNMVLATQRTVVDFALHVGYEYQDIVPMVDHRTMVVKPTLIARIIPRRSSSLFVAMNSVSQEWLYVVDEAKDDNSVNGKINQVFELLIRPDGAGAARELLNTFSEEDLQDPRISRLRELCNSSNSQDRRSSSFAEVKSTL